MKRSTLIVLFYIIIIAGVLLRMVIYLHNRSLILDEANVAKNLYERDLASLFSPLNYAQFAPPLFLCAERIAGNSLGFSEMMLRLVPLLCSFLSLWLLLRVLQRLVSLEALWYPLLLMAFGYIFFRYATELKQYSSDVLITLMLICTALHFDITKTKPVRFCVVWAIVGSAAIWSSMPSVFILCGVGGYYLCEGWTPDGKRILHVLIAGLIWASQFLVYYLHILGHDTNNTYLLNWHDRYFFVLLPHTVAQLQHNAELCISILSTMGGHTVLAVAFHLCLIVAGLVHLFRRRTATALLLFVPLVVLLVACGLHKFTLLPRVILFAMPLLLILTGVGLQQAFAMRSRVFKGVVTAIAVVCAANYCQFQYFYRPFKIEELKDGLQVLQKEKIDGAHLHVNFLVVPIYEYYTTIHPCKAKWSDLAGAHCTAWHTDHDSLVQQLSGTHAFLYEWCDEDRFKSDVASDRKYSQKVSVIPFIGGNVVVLEK